jgi:hypothetical protein
VSSLALEFVMKLHASTTVHSSGLLHDQIITLELEYVETRVGQGSYKAVILINKNHTVKCWLGYRIGKEKAEIICECP